MLSLALHTMPFVVRGPLPARLPLDSGLSAVSGFSLTVQTATTTWSLGFFLIQRDHSCGSVRLEILPRDSRKNATGGLTSHFKVINLIYG